MIYTFYLDKIYSFVFYYIRTYCSTEYAAYDTVCPRSSDPFYTVNFYIKWVTTSWTYSILYLYLILYLLTHNVKCKTCSFTSRAFHKLLQIYTTNHATFQVQMHAITVLITYYRHCRAMENPD